MVAPAFECRTIRMQKGDTLYIPKGMVHYARSPEESPVVSVHMTISQDRHSGSWLDYVASEPPFHLPASTDRICLFPSAMQYARTPQALYERYADMCRRQCHHHFDHFQANALNVRAERLAPLVRNTQLGVELARLAPVNGARLLPLPPGGFVFGADIKPAAVDYAARAAAKVWPLVLADDRRMVEAAMSEALVEAFQMQDIVSGAVAPRSTTEHARLLLPLSWSLVWYFPTP